MAEPTHLPHVLRHLPAGVATLLGPELRVGFANAALEAVLGAPVAAGPSLVAQPGAVPPDLVTVMQQVYQSGHPFVAKAYGLPSATAPGAVAGLRYYDLTLEPVLEHDGGVSALLLFAVDVTAQEQARRHAHELAIETRRLDARLRVLTETVPLITFTVDAAGRPAYVSPQWYYFTGQPPTAGSPEGWLKEQSRDLVQSLVIDALVSGKFALFPNIDSDGKVRVTALSGFLWPIFVQGDSNDIAGLLQVTSYYVDAKLVYDVRRYSDGLLEVFRRLDDWQAYAIAVPQNFPQPHTLDRLPVALRIAGRDANRNPQGLVQTAMPAYLAYLKAAILVNFLAHRGGFEERVVKSDALFQLAKSDPKNALVTDLKKVGVNNVRLLDSGGDYLRLAPVQLADYQKQAHDARADVHYALNIPDLDGTRLSGDALVEKRESYSETVNSLAALIAQALTEAHLMMVALQPTVYKPGWRVALTPHFARDTASERLALREDFKAGILPEEAALSGLQSLGVSYVTEDMVKAAQDKAAADLVPSVPPAANPAAPPNAPVPAALKPRIKV